MEVLAALRKRFRIIHHHSIGVHVDAGGIFVVLLKRADEQWYLSGMDELHLPAGDYEEEAVAAADMLRMHCARNGWPVDLLSVCLSGRGIFMEKIELPSLDDAAVPEAVHWEVEGRDVFGERDFRTVFMKCGEDGHTYWVAAMERAEAEIWESTWKEHDLVLSQLTVMPPVQESLRWDRGSLTLADAEVLLEEGSYENASSGFVAALYAAMLGAGLLGGQTRMSFSRQCETDHWNWRVLCLTVACSAALCLGIAAGWDFWQLHAARGSLESVQQECMLLGKEQEEKERIENCMQEAERRNSVLAALSRERLPWYSMLVHFGCMTVEGVYIKEITLSGQNVLDIEGEAVTFDALSDFLKKFEEDKEFFPEGPVLKTSSVEGKGLPGDMICFSLQMKL